MLQSQALFVEIAVLEKIVEMGAAENSIKQEALIAKNTQSVNLFIETMRGLGLAFRKLIAFKHSMDRFERFESENNQKLQMTPPRQS